VTATGGVYVIQSPSGKYRVGLTCNFRQRFYCYQSSARTGRKENTHWINAMRKYGWSSMRIGILPLPKEQRSMAFQLCFQMLPKNLVYQTLALTPD